MVARAVWRGTGSPGSGLQQRGSSGGAYGGASPTTTAAVPGTTANPASGTGGAGAQVELSNFAFSSASITVKVGGTVTWMNKDSTAHTVTADDGSFDSSDLASGATFSHTFSKAGSVPYHRKIHSAMHGTIVVQ
ncbi:MAG: cupredoxin family copper-binding protein [Actinobacteria bacterium]|nr:cupredoxin family copper-binding protein [Actinomycetota bacterium]